MKTILASALALGAMTSFALAEPITSPTATSGPVMLSTAQMDGVTAGAPPKDIQKQQAKQGGYPYGQRNSGKCANHGDCKNQ